MRIRYSGADHARDLALSGGFITFQRMEWVDVEAAAEAAGIPVRHALVTAREVVKQDDWQHEGATKAARTRKKAAESTQPDEAPADTTDPAEPVNEENEQ